MKRGDRFTIFDEAENERILEVQDIDRRSITAHVKESVSRNSEPKVKVSLYQAIPKKPALFELIVQKATEIGVSEIFPLITERTENRRMSKFERLHIIAMEATEQSGRTKIPVIHHPANYDEILPKQKNGFIAYEYEGEKYLSDYAKELAGAKELSIIIGPEGGLSKKEIELAKKYKLHSFTFGPRILRTETAAISALSLVLLNR